MRYDDSAVDLLNVLGFKIKIFTKCRNIMNGVEYLFNTFIPMSTLSRRVSTC